MIISIVAVAFSLFLIYQLNQDKNTENTSEQKTTFRDDETVVYLDDKNAKNEILFAFDYSCPWCTVWIKEVFPDLQKHIEAGEVTFRTQSLGLLNPMSVKLSEVDQNMKVHYPDAYYNAFLTLIQDSTEIDITDDYLQGLADANDMDLDVLLSKPDMDMIGLTKDYVEGFEIETVPSVLVNGKKLKDPFDLKEIEALLTRDQ